MPNKLTGNEGVKMEPTIDDLDRTVKQLLDHADRIKSLIESHDFSVAEIEAVSLSMFCGGANRLANNLADSP